MLQKKYVGGSECRSQAGPINAQALSRAAVVIAAGFGLAACVGPYDDGYRPYHTQYQSSPTYYYDSGYASGALPPTGNTPTRRRISGGGTTVGGTAPITLATAAPSGADVEFGEARTHREATRPVMSIALASGPLGSFFGDRAVLTPRMRGSRFRRVPHE